VKRLADLIRALWYYRPVITTYQRQLDLRADRYGDGFTSGMAEAASHAGTIYQLGYDAGVNDANGTWPTPPCPRHEPASRTTTTGSVLVSV
jgi:hypothetical protein